MINASNCTWCHGVSDAQSATGSLCGKPEGLSGSKACSDEKNWDDASMKTQQNQACKHALMTHFFFSFVFVAPPWLQSPLLLVASLGLVKDLVHVFLTNGFDDGRELVGLQLHRQVCGPGTLPLHQAMDGGIFHRHGNILATWIGWPPFLGCLGARGILEQLLWCSSSWWWLVVLRIPFLHQPLQCGRAGKTGIQLASSPCEQLDDGVGCWPQLDICFVVLLVDHVRGDQHLGFLLILNGHTMGNLRHGGTDGKSGQVFGISMPGPNGCRQKPWQNPDMGTVAWPCGFPITCVQRSHMKLSYGKSKYILQYRKSVDSFCLYHSSE